MAEKRRAIRCAIYTRKSTEDGLDQEFNSLDAQFEACAAYIASQRHEGWTQLPGRYDDGGFSGGTLQRPGLSALLAEVEAGRVDVIVVYKVDRLTRSLADFAKIVETLDARQASFVSITQAFNTTTSMGRLTLNVLLSFAQFEREVTGERIRDKIAASKRKGLWMGGPVPLGYDVRDRKLVVNESEASTVRHIMKRYIALGSVRELVEELAATGARTKVQHRTSGPHRGGIPFARGALFHLLKNRIYRGEIVHKGEAHSGEHEPIVPLELWDSVQAKLAARSHGPSERLPALHPSLLAGKVQDGLGRAMTPSHTTKGKRRYRYYATRPESIGGDAPAWRVSAYDLEQLAVDRVAALLADRIAIHDLVARAGGSAAQVNTALRAADTLAEVLRVGRPAHCRDRLGPMIEEVQLHEHRCEIVVAGSALLEQLEVGLALDDDHLIRLSCATARVRRGHEIKLVIPSRASEAPAVRRDEKLVALLAEARAAKALIMASPEKPLARIAAEAGRCRSRLGKLAGLACLAPDIVAAILAGKQPPGLTAKALLASELPHCWKAQRITLGAA